MEVIVENNKSTDKFSDLYGGDTFIYVDTGEVWMKLANTYCYDDKDVNAVSLDDGVCATFNNRDNIVAIKTKVVNA